MPTIPTVIAAGTVTWVLGFVVVIVFFVLWLYCLFNLLADPARGAGSKAVWAIALILLAPFAIVAYLLFGRRRD